jgi:leucyl-tRNA synthetase
MPKINWREYLSGEHIVEDDNLRYKYDHDIHQRAIRMMRDLLLIAEKSSSRQKTQIFKKSETRDKLIIPLIMALHNNSAFLTPEQKEFEDITQLMQDLELTGIKYDFERLFDTTHPDHKIYCEHKRQWVSEKLKEIGKRTFSSAQRVT